MIRNIALPLLLCIGSGAQALPIGFGMHQDKLRYDETRSDNFLIYHDRRTPQEAAMIINSLEAARPFMEAWFDLKKDKRLTVVSSAASSNASFANFVTRNIELQTLGQGDRDLFWHEYTHDQMYRFYQYAGSASALYLHLPWMANWWIEGLAELLSQSQGSDLAASAERMAALSKNWPSFDGLHSLYSGHTHTQVGYGLSGMFMHDLMRQGFAKSKETNLGDIHRKYRKYTMPWHLMWSLVPIVGNTPMDALSKKYTNKSTRKAFESYKARAKKHWEKSSKAPLRFIPAVASKKAAPLGNLKVYQSFDTKLGYLTMSRKESWLGRFKLTKDSGGGWLNPQQPTIKRKSRNKKTLTHTFIARKDFVPLQVRIKQRFRKEAAYEFWVKGSQDVKYKKTITREARIQHVSEYADGFVWIEHETQNSRICFVQDKNWTSGEFSDQNVTCTNETRLPATISYLGTSVSKKRKGATHLWFSERNQTLKGDHYKIKAFTLKRKRVLQHPKVFSQKPISVATSKGSLWVITAGRSHRQLQKYDLKGNCLGQIWYAELPQRVFALGNDNFAVQISNLYSSGLLVERRASQKLKKCDTTSRHSSPLLFAMNQKKPASFAAAIQGADLWQVQNSPALTGKEAELSRPESISIVPTRKAKYRLKHGATSPWVGADPEGISIGVLSMPLMDFSQNEELRLSALWGLTSEFPDVDLTVRSTRFWPLWSINARKTIAFNGAFIGRQADGTQQLIASFFDSTSAGISASLPWQPILNISTTLSYRFYDRKFYSQEQLQTNAGFRSGKNHEFGIGTSHLARMGRWSLSTAGQFTFSPNKLNKELVYNNLNLSQTIYMPKLGRVSTNIGWEYSRSRGSKQLLLRQLYRPLKTFVAGEGSGFNNFHLEAKDYFEKLPPGGLFSARYGDNQARTKFNLSFPIVKHMDKLLYIFYLQRIDLANFVNFGGAWSGESLDIPFNRFEWAHGHSLDMQFEAKGLQFSLGLGAGRALESDNYDYYLNFSFDNFLEI